MPRLIGLAGVAAAIMIAASPAAAQSRCTAPETPGWHSCLAASSHPTNEETVHLTTVRPRLVIRYADGCPRGADRRTVTIRTRAGERLARERLRSRCRRGVARYDVKLRLELDIPRGTVVRSYWSGIRDAEEAPAVRLDP